MLNIKKREKYAFGIMVIISIRYLSHKYLSAMQIPVEHEK